jgi:hypothetical protein
MPTHEPPFEVYRLLYRQLPEHKLGVFDDLGKALVRLHALAAEKPDEAFGVFDKAGKLVFRLPDPPSRSQTTYLGGCFRRVITQDPDRVASRWISHPWPSGLEAP